MRELYDQQAESRKSNGQKKGGRPKKESNNLVVKVPPSLPKAESQTEEQIEAKVSTKTRDIVGKIVGVSGSYIDAATKVLKSDIPGLADAVRSRTVNLSKAAKAV